MSIGASSLLDHAIVDSPLLDETMSLGLVLLGAVLMLSGALKTLFFLEFLS